MHPRTRQRPLVYLGARYSRRDELREYEARRWREEAAAQMEAEA